MVYLHNIWKWEAGSVGGAYFKIEMVINYISLILTGNNFAVIHVSMFHVSLYNSGVRKCKY